MAGIDYEYRTANREVSHDYLYPIVSRCLEGVPKGANVLDLGCGNGTFLSLFRDRGWKLHGTDFSPTGIQFAQNNFPEIGFFLANAEADSSDIVNRIGMADVIISTEVIEHLYNPRGFLKTCSSVLKQNGTLILTTPYHGYLKNLFLAATGKMDQHFTALWDHGHIKFWSHKTIREVLEETGFEVLQIDGAGRFPYLWKSMVVKARKAKALA